MRATRSPSRACPFWPVASIFAVSLLLGALAIWSSSSLYLLGSGVLFNVNGLILFSAWAALHPNLAGDERISYFLLAQVLSFGSAAIVWSLLERVLHQRNFDISHGIAPATQGAILGGLQLLAVDVVVTNAMHLSGDVIHANAILGWVSSAP